MLAIHHYPRRSDKPFLNLCRFAADLSSGGNAYHFSTTLTVKKFLLVSSLVLGAWSRFSSPVLRVATPCRASTFLNIVSGSSEPVIVSILYNSCRSCLSRLACSVSKFSSLHFSSYILTLQVQTSSILLFSVFSPTFGYPALAMVTTLEKQTPCVAVHIECTAF